MKKQDHDSSDRSASVVANADVWNDFRHLLCTYLLAEDYPLAARIMGHAESQLSLNGGFSDRFGEVEYWIYQAHIALFFSSAKPQQITIRTRLIPAGIRAAPGWPFSLIDVLCIYRSRQRLPSKLEEWIFLLELLVLEKREQHLAIIDRVVNRQLNNDPTPVLQAAILLSAGRAANHLGRPSRAETFLRQAVAAAQRAGYPVMRARALLALGAHFVAREMTTQALPLLLSALDLFLRIGDYLAAARVRLLAARVQLRHGSWREAALSLNEVVLAARMLSAADLELQAQLQLANLDLKREQHSDARRRLLSQLFAARSGRDSDQLINLYLLLIQCYTAMGCYRQAQITRRTARRLLLLTDVKQQLAIAYQITTAELLLAQCEFTQAMRHVKRARTMDEAKPSLHLTEKINALHLKILNAAGKPIPLALQSTGTVKSPDLHSSAAGNAKPIPVRAVPPADPAGSSASLRRERRPSFWRRYGIITASNRVHNELTQVGHISRASLPVLIHGETGSGKELVAKAIHTMSGNCGRFIVFNSATARNDLFEAELFGHRKGAFTGAISNRDGLIAQAKGGTLFLDEIADLSAAAQASMLRFLDSGEVRAVGSDKVVQVKTRVISASHHGLRSLVAAGKFRRDLFFRLAGIEVRLPPLRERVEDIRPLIEHFAHRAGIEKQVLNKMLSGPMTARLGSYSWPGNVRQLSHWVAQLAALLAGDLPLPQINRLLGRALTIVFASEDQPPSRRSLVATPSRIELERLVVHHDGIISRIAADLGTYRTHVYRLLRERGIDHTRYRKQNPPE